MPQDKSAVFTFGRMNPPTVGHEKLINKTVSHAKENGADHFVYVSHTQDNKKNPLSAEDKVGYIQKAMPGVNVRSSSKEAPSFMHVAKQLHNEGYKHLTMIAGSDRTDHYTKLLHQYNGPNKEYNFKSINVVSAGNRDPKAKGAEGMSGTKMREAALSGDKTSFKSGLMSGLKDEHKEEIYHKIRSAMGVKESMEKPIPYLLMTEAQKKQFLKPFTSFTSPRFEQVQEDVNKAVAESKRLASFKDFIAGE